MDAGALKGDQQGNINLSESMARSLIISKRYAENLVRKYWTKKLNISLKKLCKRLEANCFYFSLSQS